MELIYAKYCNDDYCQLYIGLFAQSLFDVVMNTCLGKATLISHDSMYGIYRRCQAISPLK